MLARDVSLGDDSGISQGQPWCQAAPSCCEAVLTRLS